MNEPPKVLDGAKVLYWLTSEGTQPFYFISEGDIAHPITAMAICRYDTGQLYLFKCDAEYEVQADWDLESIEEAFEMVRASQSIDRQRWQPVDA